MFFVFFSIFVIMRKIVTYGGYFESFMESLTQSQQKKIKQLLLVIKTVDRIPAKFIGTIAAGLFELRAEFESNTFRVFFIFDKGNVIVLLNGFQKKSPRTPQKEVEKALRIKEEYAYATCK